MTKTNNKIKNFIFDVDGVIVSTDELHYKAWKATANKIGVNLTRENNKNLKGVARALSLKYILTLADNKNQVSDQEFNELLIYKNNLYKKAIKKLSTEDIFPNVIKTFTTLKEYGYLISLGSASLNAPTILKQLGLIKYFDNITDISTIKTTKSSGELFKLVADSTKSPMESCYVIEDSQAGVDGSNRLGMNTICYDVKKTLKQCKYVVQNHQDLIELIKKL